LDASEFEAFPSVLDNAASREAFRSSDGIVEGESRWNSGEEVNDNVSLGKTNCEGESKEKVEISSKLGDGIGIPGESWPGDMGKSEGESAPTIFFISSSR
jgi:hypothetical protein